MANLFEINERLYSLLENGYDESCIDPETGEFDEEKANRLIEAVQAERGEKIDGIALYIEKLDADAALLKTKCDTLTQRKKSLEAKADRLRDYLSGALHYEKYESENVKIGFRKSESVTVTNETILPDRFFSEKTVRAVDRNGIKAAIKAGETVPGACLTESRNISIR